MNKKTSKKTELVMLCVFGYLSLSMLVFSFRNPEFTNMQCMLHFLDAVTWNHDVDAWGE